jgi:hypothetical protein
MYCLPIKPFVEVVGIVAVLVFKVEASAVTATMTTKSATFAAVHILQLFTRTHSLT